MFVRLRPGMPIGEQIARGLRAAVLDGRLPPGSRVPPTRQLALDLRVSRTIVLVAYEQVRAEGYFVGRPGSGTFVADTIPDDLLHAPAPRQDGPAGRRPARLSAGGRRVVETPALRRRESRLPFDFRYWGPSERDFPHRAWRRLVARHALRTATQYDPPEGAERLRRALAAYLRRSRGVPCEWQQVVVVNGSQQALDLLARLLLDPGDSAVVEDPGYDGARAVLRAVGARITPVPVDDQGLRTDRLPRKGSRLRLAVTTPSHQFPLGGTLPIGRRLELLDWATRRGAYVIEDDYDGEFRYAQRPVEPLIGLDPEGLVIYVGTLSKVLSPVLRIGYIVLPSSLVEPFAQLKFVADCASPAITQEPLAEFIQSGQLESHIRRTRARNAERRDALVAAVTHHFADRARLRGANAGGHIVLELVGASVDEIARLASRAAGVGVGVAPIAPFFMRSPGAGLFLCYQGMSPSNVRTGIERLAGVI